MENKILTAILVDDEQEAINYLLDLVKSFKEIKILGSFTDATEAIDEILTLKPEILFLDVQMPEKTGFDILNDVSGQEYKPFVIFTTAYEKYAIEAIRYAAFDYLLKPINETELANAIERLKQKDYKYNYDDKLKSLFNELEQSKKLKFNTSTGFIVLNTKEIIYCQASRNYCEIHLTDDRCELVTCSMNNAGKMLPENEFFRISRFNIINLRFLKRVERRNHTCYLKTVSEAIQLNISPRNAKLLERYYAEMI